MNEKISLRKISDQMSAIDGCSASESQVFVKTLFSTVATHLCQGNSVDLNGIGVFSPAPNVKNPIKFCADPKLAALLNAPFAFFEAVSIGDDISAVDIEKIEAPEMSVIEDDNEDLLTSVSHNESNAEVKHEDDVIIKSDSEDEVLTELETETKSEREHESVPEFQPARQIEVKDQIDQPVEESFETAESSETEIETETSLHEEDNACIITNPTEKTTKEEIDESPELKCENNSVTDPTPLADDDQATIIPEEEEEFIEYYDQPKSRFWPGFIVGLILGLFLAALAFAWYVLFYVGAPN